MLEGQRQQADDFNGQNHRAIMAVAMCLLLVVAIFGSVALAKGDPGSEESPGPLIPPTADTIEELNALVGAGEEVSLEPVTNPEAANALAHSDLNRNEAEDLLVSVFPTATETPAGIFSDLEVESFRSDYVAVVPADSPEESAGLLTSLLPLRTEDTEGTNRAVDLSLEESPQGSLSPENPIVELSIPATAAGEFRLPEAGIGIELASPQGGQSASTIDGDAAFYPNIAEDSDLVVAPTPTGFETFTQLRSPAAPTTHRFDLTLPHGASLESTSDGGAVVLKDGEPLVVVKPPTAFDADGQAVAVALDVAGDSIMLQASPSQGSVYPILVDPLWENYSWKDTNSNAGIGTDWRSYTSPNQSLFTANWIGNLNTTLYSGLALRSFPGAIAPGTTATWNYYVPRYFSDYENPAIGTRPTSFIRNMSLSQVYYLVEENSSAAQPSLTAGIWDSGKGVFHSSVVKSGTEGGSSNATISLPNSQENINVKNGGIALSSQQTTSYKRQAYVGSASVEISDKDVPTWGFLPNPGIWTNNSSAVAPFDYAVGDSGLGISYVKVTRPQASGGSSDVWTSYQCAGSASNPCPATAETATRAITYDPGAMAQGESTVSVVAQDPVGNLSAPKLVKVKVDHDKPTAELAGNLTEQASVGTKLSKYTLNYTAKDGDDAAAAALEPIGTAAGQLDRPMGVAVDATGNTFVVDRIKNRVVKYDANGAYVTAFGSTGSADGQFNDPRGIAVSPDGTVWVTDLGNDRIQAFNSNGGFLRKAKFTDPASEPYAITSAPGGVIWVTDIGLHRIVKLAENPITSLLNATGNGTTNLSSPVGITSDEFGNVWVSDNGLGKILEFDSAGKLLFQFGTSGSGNGQLNGPVGIDIAPSGNIAVVDRNNNRVQIFRPDGSYLRQFGTGGSSTSSQLSEASGISFGPNNTAVIADSANHRVARWSHADQDPQSGVTKIQVKVDGTVKMTNAPGCGAGKNCSLSGSWTLNADDYTAGSHKVEVLATDGVNFVTEKVLNIETHGDLTAPTIALSGSITEQATLGKTLPAYKVKVAASDPGPAEERKSGVGSIVIKVDGTTVDSTSPGCPSEGCSLSREWTLSSSSKAPGLHSMEVIATDATGKTKSAVQAFEIKRDETAPELKLSGDLGEAPQGWVQEGTRSLTTDSTDVGGYGVKQTRFQIDGQTVGESLTQTCELGGCSKSKTFWIDMTVFGGGAHEGVAIAEDLAGNIRKKTWTINIDPLGNITVSEATDTLEAVEVTAPEAVGSTAASGLVSGASGEAGIDPGLTQGSGELVSVDSPTPSTVSSEATQGFGVETSATTQGGQTEQSTIEVAPLNLPPGVGSPQMVEGAAAVVSNSSPSTDTILRPVYMGLMTFQDIRDTVGPETYSWQVKLGPDEILKSIDSQNAGVFWEDGTQAMLIATQAAHDAHGVSVPTSLAVSEGNVITLTVHHRVPSVVYPVVVGIGWEGGFRTEEATVSEPEAEEEVMSYGTVGPPEALPLTNTDSDGASASASRRHYSMPVEWDQCFSDVEVLGFQPGCAVGKLRTELKFEYNHAYAWWKNSKPHPKCPNSSSVLSMNLQYCEWIGPNHQPYGAGYHISALNESVQTNFGAATFTETEHLTIYMYGSGYAAGHNTNHICNPLKSC